MFRKLTPRSSLDGLRREAKRWLKALRAHDPEALARLANVHPVAGRDPSLRDVQHALAREHGLSGWPELKAAVASAAPAFPEREPHDAFLQHACPDHRVQGVPRHSMARHAADRLLTRFPRVAESSLYAAVVAGDLGEVQRRLDLSPQDAGKAGGPKGWEPLLYLSFARVSAPPAHDSAVAAATALLDHGANPNVFFMAGDSTYTPLVGVIGEGEEDRPPHRDRNALVQLLLDHGARPFDQQVLYNLHFHGSVQWYLEVVHAHTAGTPLHGEWSEPDWPMFDMGSYGTGARYLLDLAIRRNDVALAQWLLEHGAHPESPTNPPFPEHTLYEAARRRGCDEIALLLVSHGAKVRDVVLSEEERLVRACMALDRDGVAERFHMNPSLKKSPGALFAMTRQDRADAAVLLLDLGVSPDVEDRHRQRALHIAGYTDAVAVGETLIQRGAAIDPVETLWQNTPLDCAIYNGSQRMVALLSEISSDVWNIAFLGRADRLRDILARNPALARSSNSNGATPLMRLPDDEARAAAVAGLLIEYGADPSARRKDGLTAADIAEHRGMGAVAVFLRAADTARSAP